MIKLRNLKEKDAVFMLEWMHDPQIQKCFQKNMMSMTLSDAENFCRLSVNEDTLKDGQSIHYAIVDDDDEYLGTISLKNINLDNSSAEYAISTRRCVHGKGIAIEATKLVLHKGFIDFNLHRIYLNVIVFRWGIVFIALIVVLVFGMYGPGFNAGNFIYMKY